MTTTATTTSRPLAATLIEARSAHKDAIEAWDVCECEDCENCEHAVTLRAARAATEASFDALMSSGEMVDWTVMVDGQDEPVVIASTAEEAMDIMERQLGRAHCEGRTTWHHIYVECELTEEADTRDVCIHPDVPQCCDDEHTWESPHAIVGGCKENPGVIGNGGGVIISEVCMSCRTLRTTNTWAQSPLDGSQGHTTYTYSDIDY